MAKQNDKPAPATENKKTSKTPRKVSDYINAWIGRSPKDVCPEIEPDTINSRRIEDILDEEIIINGFSKRVGEYGEFAIILGTRENDPEPFIISCGGAVVVRKLAAIGEHNGYPVTGTFIRPDGKRYFDLV